jgi:hypothetical protein
MVVEAAASVGSTCIAIKICLCQLYNETTCVPGHRMTRRIVSLGWFSEKAKSGICFHTLKFIERRCFKLRMFFKTVCLHRRGSLRYE